jgi:hypothetical protein
MTTTKPMMNSNVVRRRGPLLLGGLALLLLSVVNIYIFGGADYRNQHLGCAVNNKDDDTARLMMPTQQQQQQQQREDTQTATTTSTTTTTSAYPQLTRGTVLDLYWQGKWRAGTVVTSVQHSSFAAILALHDQHGGQNTMMVHNISLVDDFRTKWRLPCMDLLRHGQSDHHDSGNTSTSKRRDNDKDNDKDNDNNNVPGGANDTSLSTLPPPMEALVPSSLLLTDQLLDRFIVVPEYKLLFCYVEKVGCAMFNLLFRLLRLLHPSMTTTEAPRLVAANGAVWYTNSPTHFHIDRATLQDMLQSNNWTKAVFYRDPVARFVSAFRSKCEQGHDYDGPVNCAEAFGNEITVLPDALYQMATTVGGGRHDGRIVANAHFTPMGRFCGGLDRTLPYYDVVEPLDPSTVGSVVTELLLRVGVDEATAHALVDGVVTTRGQLSHQDDLVSRVRDRFGLPLVQGVDERHNTGMHHGGSASTTNDTTTGTIADDWDEFMSTPEAIHIVEDFYASDFALFRLPTSSQRPFCPPRHGPRNHRHHAASLTDVDVNAHDSNKK